MRIIILGNMGYVGPAVVNELRQSYPNSFLVGLDTGYFSHCLTGARRLPESLLDRQIFMDIRDVDFEVIKSFDTVINLIAISNDIMGELNTQLTEDINFKHGLRIAEIAKKAGIKNFIFASSCSVYGEGSSAARTEKDSVNPLTTYAKSKIDTEIALSSLANEQFYTTCLRFATACGMSPRLRLDLVLNDFVACALSSNKITVLSDGSPWRPLIHIKDMARAITWAVSRRTNANLKIPNLILNAGSNEWNYQIADIAQTVASLIPKTRVEINKDAQPDKRSYRVDFSMFEKLAPSHQPKMSLEQTVRELHEGLSSIKFKDSNFRHSEYMRIQVLLNHQRELRLDSNLRWL